MAANLWVVPVSAAKDGLYEEAVVISGDSDLVEPIREANRRYGPVHVKNPRDVPIPKHRAPAYGSVGQAPGDVAVGDLCCQAGSRLGTTSHPSARPQ